MTQTQIQIHRSKFTQLFKIGLFLKFFTIFGTCNAVPTNPSEVSIPPFYSYNAGAVSQKLSNRGYSLTKAKMWKSGPFDDKNANGIQLTYTADCCGLADIVHMYGT